MAYLGRARGGTTVTSEPEGAEDLDAATQFVGGDVTGCFSGRRVGPFLCDRAVLAALVPLVCPWKGTKKGTIWPRKLFFTEQSYECHGSKCAEALSVDKYISMGRIPKPLIWR